MTIGGAAIKSVLKEVRDCARHGRVMLTYKAFQEMQGLGLGLDKADVCEVLESLNRADFAERVQSTRTGEWMYVFKPRIADTPVYLKIILRAGCVVISFHEEGIVDEEE